MTKFLSEALLEITPMKPAVLAIAMFVMVLGGPAAHAGSKQLAVSNTPPPPVADIEAGKAVAGQCISCHNEDGISTTPMVPHIAGQHVDYIVKVLRSYRMAVRKGEVMKDHIGDLSGDDMINVSAYFASLEPFPNVVAKKKKPGPGGKAPAVDPLSAAREAAEPCAACHGEDGNSEVPGTPGIAGMHPQFLEWSMKAYKEGTRPDEVMQAFIEPLSQSDIENIATFYALAKPVKTEFPGDGDVRAGAAAAAACVSCHGVDGNTDDPGTPRLAGMDAEYFITSVKAYKDGTRDHAVMKDLVSPLSDADVENAAAFYATQTPHAPATLVSITASEWAEKCDRCHGKDGYSTDPRFPIIAGQSEAYLLRALKIYHTEKRKDTMMRAMSFPLREADFRDMAAYYASKAAR
jgi:cytochrome c553